MVCLEVDVVFCGVFSEINSAFGVYMLVEICWSSVVNSDVVVDVLSSLADVAVVVYVFLGVGLADPEIQRTSNS